MFLSLAICLIGLLVFLATGGKPSEAGKWAYIIGLAAFLLNADRVVALFR